MPDKRTSRAIIWHHALDYQWMCAPNVGGDPRCDAFTLRARDGLRQPLLVVHYTRDGRVLDVYTNGLRLPRRNRDSVMDDLEGRNV